MEEIKNSNEVTANDASVSDAAPEEVMEVVLQDTEETVNTAENDSEVDGKELSGLTDSQRKRKIIFDKITTAILVLILIAPVAILAFIFLWFIFR